MFIQCRKVAGLCSLLFAVLLTLSCDKGQGQNPTSLWLSYAQSELDLVLIDHEPPPF